MTESKMGSYTGGHNADKRTTKKNQNGSAALGRPAMKLLGMASHEITLYQNSLNGSAPFNKMATRAKNRKILKRQLLLYTWANFV